MTHQIGRRKDDHLMQVLEKEGSVLQRSADVYNLAALVLMVVGLVVGVIASKGMSIKELVSSFPF